MKTTVYIHAEYDDYDKKYNFKAWPMDMSNTPHCGVLVEAVEVEFTPIPHDVLVNGTIAKYREQQSQIRAKAQLAVNELDKRIQDLQCIEYKPEAATV